MLITNYVDENRLPNLESVMEYYGIKAQTGIVIEGDSNYYLSEYVYYLMPDITSHAITAPIIEAGYDFIMPVAQGLIISENVRDSLSVISLFDTSGKSYSKTEGYSITTYEKEENDIDGPFSLGATVTEGDTNIVWLSSAMFLDDTANEYSNGANEDVFLNSLNWLCGIEDGITIHSKNLSSEHLTISSAAKSILTFVFVIFVPLALLSAGIITAVIRRRRG